MIKEYVFRLIYQKGETKDIPCESVMDLVDCLLQYSQEADNQYKILKNCTTKQSKNAQNVKQNQ